MDKIGIPEKHLNCITDYRPDSTKPSAFNSIVENGCSAPLREGISVA